MEIYHFYIKLKRCFWKSNTIKWLQFSILHSVCNLFKTQNAIEFSLYSPHIRIYSFFPCLSGIQTDILLPPFIYNRTLFFTSHREFGRTIACREAGMRHQQQDPSASVAQHGHDLTSSAHASLSPLLQYMNTFRVTTHNLTGPKRYWSIYWSPEQAKDCAEHGYFRSGSAPSVNTNSM